MVRLSEADRALLELAFKQAKERQNMSRRTIDETGRDVPQPKGRQVREELWVRPDAVMGRVAEWLPIGAAVPLAWDETCCVRVRIILDNAGGKRDVD